MKKGKQQLKKFETRFGIKILDISAKNKINIKEIFTETVDLIANRIDNNYYFLDYQTYGIKQNYFSKNNSKLNNSKIKSKKSGFCYKNTLL